MAPEHGGGGANVLSWPSMLRWRFPLAVLIIAALAGLCWLDAHSTLAGLWLLPAALVFTVLASGEVLYLAAQGGMSPQRAIVYLSNLALVVSPWAPMLAQYLGYHWAPAGGALPLMVLAIAVLLVFLGEMRRYQKPGGVTANIAAAVFALVYVGVMLSFAVELRLTWGMAALAIWLITVKMGDIGAYTVGRLVGRHKMAPLLSPGKTLEGAAGALGFACLGAWASLSFLAPAISPHAAAGRPGMGLAPVRPALGRGRHVG